MLQTCDVRCCVEEKGEEAHDVDVARNTGRNMATTLRRKERLLMLDVARNRVRNMLATHSQHTRNIRLVRLAYQPHSQHSSCSLGLSATSQQYFSLRTNQPPATSQQYFSLTTNQHQPSATSQTNRVIYLVDFRSNGRQLSILRSNSRKPVRC
jgi:hypothetical protein